ncbi:MAG: hypothetical protein AVDCRST_MAG24-1002, partial [uncultured Nocardioidaceae bacterium]
ASSSTGASRCPGSSAGPGGDRRTADRHARALRGVVAATVVGRGGCAADSTPGSHVAAREVVL